MPRGQVDYVSPPDILAKFPNISTFSTLTSSYYLPVASITLIHFNPKNSTATNAAFATLVSLKIILSWKGLTEGHTAARSNVSGTHYTTEQGLLLEHYLGLLIPYDTINCVEWYLSYGEGDVI